MTTWAYLAHPEIGGHSLFPDDPATIAHYEARGWERRAFPEGLDPADPAAFGQLHEALANAPAPEPILSEDQVAELKGKALDDALDAAGLSKSGTVAEKRDRLADHEAELANPTPTDAEPGAVPSADPSGDDQGVSE
jgi:hypothetical protein